MRAKVKVAATCARSPRLPPPFPQSPHPRCCRCALARTETINGYLNLIYINIQFLVAIATFQCSTSHVLVITRSDSADIEHAHHYKEFY